MKQVWDGGDVLSLVTQDWHMSVDLPSASLVEVMQAVTIWLIPTQQEFTGKIYVQCTQN